MRTKELLALGVFGGGSRLVDRIERLLERGRVFSPRASRGRIATSLVALLGCLIAGALAPRLIAFAQTRPAFEVASVRPGTDSEGVSMRWNAQGIEYSRAPLTRIIAEAYQIPYARISSHDSRVQGMLSMTFDIIAKAERPVPREQLMLMLQTLLADRFKMAAHHESKVEPVYKLTIAKGGPKLQETAFEDAATTALGQDGELVFRNIEMWRFSAYLTGRMDRPVVDLTELGGAFDFNLKMGSLQDAANVGDDAAKRAMNDWSSSSIFRDMEKQLGLELKADKGPVDYLVIDHLEKPDAN
jgi:uncharacterized protein (TIGR03435 family)